MKSDIQKNIEQAENQIEGFKEQVEMGECAQRLMVNPDFKKFILGYFCTEECARYAQVSGDSNLSDRARADAMAVAQSAGHLKRFLHTSVMLAEQAPQGIKDVQEFIEAQRNEPVEE